MKAWESEVVVEWVEALAEAAMAAVDLAAVKEGHRWGWGWWRW